MRTTRAYFRYALRFAKRQRETAEADLLARDLSNKDVDHFWKTVHKLNSNSTTQAMLLIVFQDKLILLIILTL